MNSNPLKSRSFYLAFFISVSFMYGIPYLMEGSDFLFVVIILSIPYVLVGIIIWAIVKSKSRNVALGILFAGLTPLLITFLFTGGCLLSGILG